MKRTLLTLTLLLLTTTLYSQSITIGDDGIVRCKGVSIGTKQTVSEVEYEVVDRGLLNQRRTQGSDLTKVCVSNVTNMSGMFSTSIFDYRPFNQPIGNWDVSSVTDMSRMFYGNPFNQPIGNWDVSSVTNMREMFMGWNETSRSSFNQPIGDWDVSSVTDMSGMFLHSSFNEPIGEWDVSSVTSMSKMFQTSPFNQPIGNWDVSSVTDMSDMFSHIFRDSPFNQPIGDWNVSNVTDMRSMFSNSQFNQPIGDWDVSKVTNMTSMFGGTPFNQLIGNWNVSNVTDMRSMFSNSQFNQPIGDWDVSKVTNMTSMFGGTPFNQLIGNWDVSSVTNMGGMFNDSQFNQPIGDWDVSSVTDMSSMFSNTIFQRNISTWCVFNIKVRPSGFSQYLSTENSPKWGVCPGISPLVPTLQTPTLFSKNISRTPFLEWFDDGISTKYYLEVYENFTLVPLIVDTLISSSRFTITKSLSPNTNILWRVRGINENGLNNEEMIGEWGPYWYFTTGLFNTMFLISPLNNSTVDELTPTLSWNSEYNSQSYTLQLSTDGFTTLIIDETVTDTTFTTPQLSYSTEYSWRVRGVNDQTIGEWSDLWSFTTTVDTSIESEEHPTEFSQSINITT
jgi:surface protein